MANDIEGLTSSETVSEHCRTTALGNESAKQVGDSEEKNDEASIRSMSHVKNEQTGDGGAAAVPNGCVHHHVLEAGILASNEERCSPSSTDHGIFSGGSDCDSVNHDSSRLPESASDAADGCSLNSSEKAESPASLTVNLASLSQHQELVGEASIDDKESDEVKSVSEVLSSIMISNDLPGVPLDMLKPESLRVVVEETRGEETAESGQCNSGVEYVMYESEKQMPEIMSLITKDLSEPYSIYTYRYFIHNWPKLCFLALHQGKCVGAIVCKLDTHKKVIKRGYIAMLAVAQEYRKRGIGSHLVIRAIKGMVADGCDEVVLETEITNKAALHLYENLGFVRDKRLFRYYLNGVDALRLKLWLK